MKDQPNKKLPRQPNHFRTLGLDRKATKDQIRSAYKALAKRWHPDNPAGDAACFRAIKDAHETLVDDTKRKTWETERAAWLAENNYVECPGCGRDVGGLEPGEAMRCGACKHPLSEATAVGHLKNAGKRFLYEMASQAEALVEETAAIGMEQGRKNAAEARHRLVDWMRQGLGPVRKAKPKQGGAR